MAQHITWQSSSSWSDALVCGAALVGTLEFVVMRRWICSDKGLMRETPAFNISVRWPIYIINCVDKTKFLFSPSLPQLMYGDMVMKLDKFIYFMLLSIFFALTLHKTHLFSRR